MLAGHPQGLPQRLAQWQCVVSAAERWLSSHEPSSASKAKTLSVNTKMLSMRESFLFAHKIYETCSEAIERSLIIGCWVHSSSRSTHSISNAVSPPHSTSGWMGNVYFPNGIINKNEERMETNWNENSLNQFEKRHIIMLVKLWGHKTRKRNSQKLTSSGESCSNKINHLST